MLTLAYVLMSDQQTYSKYYTAALMLFEFVLGMLWSQVLFG